MSIDVGERGREGESAVIDAMGQAGGARWKWCFLKSQLENQKLRYWIADDLNLVRHQTMAPDRHMQPSYRLRHQTKVQRIVAVLKITCSRSLPHGAICCAIPGRTMRASLAIDTR